MCPFPNRELRRAWGILARNKISFCSLFNLGCRRTKDSLISMSNLTDSGSLTNRSSKVTNDPWMYSLLMLPLYESNPWDSLSLNSKVCFIRSTRLLARYCSYTFKECERVLKPAPSWSPHLSMYLFSANDGKSAGVDCASLMYMNCEGKFIGILGQIGRRQNYLL